MITVNVKELTLTVPIFVANCCELSGTKPLSDQTDRR